MTVLSGQLETLVKSKDDLYEQLDKFKKENDDLLFQLEEKNIELEGTRARVRVLEKIQQHQPTRPTFESNVSKHSAGENFTFLENDHLRSKGFSESEINRARQIFLESQNKKVDKLEITKILNRSKTLSSSSSSTHNVSNVNAGGSIGIGSGYELEKSGNMIPILALPLPTMASHQSSGTESTQALEISLELEADNLVDKVEKSESLKNEKSPYKRRPSKIPLNISKTSKCMKSGLSEGSIFSKKSDGELNKTKESNNGGSLKKMSLDNNNSSHNSINFKNQNLSMKSYNSVGGRPNTLSRKNQNETWDNANNHTNNNSNKRTLRSSFRESVRSKISIDGNVSNLKRDGGSLSGGSGGTRRDSLSSQLKQNRTNSTTNQQKTNNNITNKSIISTESVDNNNTKVRPTKLSFLSNWLRF
ncbi:conserved hypothetical protein [Pediculus humanus corporis]|uniref:Uncharacterized protein n=1 Tax=Pediculus humanus subsp. corporis TaxID=121224 RepID=E0W177_PEDHC|nr:uncharacterized protein Phum_PHUM570150 [Pediculus humanus corporis]EEB19383.1 conserved hypothetical protein [Pediculus humanus corporis]